MATWIPRMRSAGRLMTTPSAVVPATASNGAIGNGTSQAVEIRARPKAQKPTSVSWASETCPSRPVSTTIDRAISVTIIDVIADSRRPASPNTRRRSAAATATIASVGRRLIGGTAGWRGSSTVPRSGTLRPNTTSTITIAANGKNESMPPSRNVGTCRRDTRCTASPSNIPMAMPTAMATPNERRRAASAAASAGTTNRL